ncbi:hypothetical protein MUY27_07430 [Mucilaginibacter sp. RS28]|uniref:Uncharacterized protein n=1 Tax=Mucilaginibacter straminoryzae TaxID=2932774 RepID=A0A9X2B9A1_9SPHI|nr:hypothetical protein [Mucilaginibacter straminoryzae]MCJ8209535.1 hypothetical protein [Mucilaginibacter straminoryzae]
MNPFEVAIPMKDHPMMITVKPGENENTYDLFYEDELCGYMICNEHNVWIYEPHHHAALLLDADQIQHLGSEISKQTKC